MSPIPRGLAPTVLILALSLTAQAAGIGQWSAPIQFPLVPAAAAPIPGTGQILAWSSIKTDQFGNEQTEPITQTAIWPQSDGSAKLFTIYRGHDMFCPGINTDFQGRLIVTGGDTSPKTSIYSRAASQKWTLQADMVKGRGYQSATTLSDGRTFTIGGSWSGGQGGKDGEVFDGTAWSLVPGALVAPMLTQDPKGVYRQDNHAWLFSWKNSTVFQAGPSIAMNWYDLKGDGAVTGAGSRGNDGDAMCGPAVMYNANAGKILAVGGSPQYSDAEATSNANLITISSYGQPAIVNKLANMAYKRIFATSTVLPDGSVLVHGGQSYGLPFTDGNSTLIPELWSPVTQRFTQMAPHAIPRNYHSVALLMEDGRVFTGGGGLCPGDFECGTNNHPDAEIFSPPYLFGADGKTPATRPVIASVGQAKYKVGATLTATLQSNGQGTITWSLIRYGSSTHTVNTDQRRVPLVNFKKTGTTNGRSSYSITLPSDAGALLPGAYMLFAMRDGVPSVSKTVYITP